ncbi:hypothetical protein LMG26858_05407 [Achromobacter anxifer]|uniref:Uncharacterized protein n=1 Tax=Achromobacter anxifer TaxID=1287737 RepID=A0A6S7ETR8_9BURK|nr:hypothetical protein [Achromobacter anxifer]CAB3922044.1 hypothetical protein LMG26858_05407 [Achromobacter anxifer]
MAKQTIVWTVIPNGRVPGGADAGRLRVSIVASPRLTPEAANEQRLRAYDDWVNWPRTLERLRFALNTGTAEIELEPQVQADAALWDRLLPKTTPVAGFVFRDMSMANLFSYSVAGVLGLARKHYGRLAVQATGTPPTLLPWRDAHPVLKDMLSDCGTRTTFISIRDRRTEIPLPGFDRFFDGGGDGIERALRGQVYGAHSIYEGRAAAPGVDANGNPLPAVGFPLRALPTRWNDAAGNADQSLMKQWNSQAEYTLFQANRFYRRDPPTLDQQKISRPDGQNVPPPPAQPEMDFHAIVASYGDYPALLRQLGLVIDCLLPADSPLDQLLAAGPVAQGRFFLTLRWDGARDAGADACPATAWTADQERFTTRPRNPDHERGMLKLRRADDSWNLYEPRSPFDVYQVDPDGAALKTVDFLLTAQNLVAKNLALGADGAVTYTTGDKQAVAALRSGGLGVARRDRAREVAQNAAAASLKNAALSGAPGSIVLYTEDLLRGYRVDVQAQLPGDPQRWRSLCQRSGVYRCTDGGAPLQLPDDEGYVKGASTSGGAEPDDQYLHESLFRWTGWSLAAPRPGRTLRDRVDPASGVQGEAPEEVQDTATEKGNGLAVSFAAIKGSLPRLRFGMPYRFRARLVDLAGNSLALDDASLERDDNATQPVVYWRFEPVDPPALVQRARVSEGESLERMVIRSNGGMDPASYRDSPDFKNARQQPASADFEYPAANERHVVPPKASQLQCETHGLFDAMMGNPAGIKQAYEISARDAATLYDAGPGTQIELVTPQALDEVATTDAVPPQLPSPEHPTGQRMAAGQYVIHREAQVLTPYLPDPAAGGFALRARPGHSLPGVTGPKLLGPGAIIVQTPAQELVLLVAHGAKWPDTQGLRIVLQERKATLTDPPCSESYPDDGAPTWDETQRVLTFYLPKGRIARLRYSSFVNPGLANIFGIPAWAGSEGERATLRLSSVLGACHMVTPDRPLVLVHATQQPVCDPLLLLPGEPQRDPGAAYVDLEARVRLHGPTTGKIEIEADWHEWVDDVLKPRPERQAGHGVLAEIPLAENYANLFSLSNAVAEQLNAADKQRAPGNRHEFGDTRFRLIRYRLRATTRFREYLPPVLYEQTDKVTRLGPVADGPLVETGADDDAGAPVLVRNGSARNTVVPASAPPDAPLLMYVLPTFRWQETPGAGKLDVTRLGNGLRVWLERPWFSSGDGELLGVVIYGDGQNFTSIPNALTPLVTQWGMDPLWDAPQPAHRTRVSDFAARVADEAVFLQELPNQRVHVVGHRVRWSEERARWYCDIELDPGRSYMPFVRLALARYQPNAIDSAKLSRVALAEFTQVLPRRRAVFEQKRGKLSFSLRGVVPAHGPMKFPLDSEYLNISFIPGIGQTAESGRNRVELVLQTRDPALDSDLAWSDAAVLASGLLDPAGPAPQPATPGPILIDRMRELPILETATPVSMTDLTRLGSVVVGPVVRFPPVLEGPILADLLDPVIWTANVALPDSGGKPARIAVREYERYYTDSAVPERRAGATQQRRVVEERLVYTAFFGL